jgi:alkylation response protein AidB-like acyl-CoA dehydrogenase
MDFGWSDSQEELYTKAFAFCREHLRREPPHGVSGELPRGAWNACGGFGLLGLSVPVAYDGMGLDALSTAHVFEAFGRGHEDAGLLFAAAAHLFACAMPIVENGSEAMKAKYLPGLASGTYVGANAITEAEAGSDVFALATTAARDGDHYVLNGAKSYVTNAPAADVFLTYAVTNKAHGYMGISAFVVSRDTPGLIVGQPFHKMGLESAPIAPVYFEGCRVSKDALLGAEGQGALVFTRSMGWERACLFALYLGVMDRQLEQAVEHAKTRKQAKRAIGKHQAISHRIADMKLRLEAARLLLYKACWAHDSGKDATLEIALSKIAVSEAAVESGLDLIRVHGGLGIMTEVGVERGLRDAIPATIFSGTSEIQRNLVAARLGL